MEFPLTNPLEDSKTNKEALSESQAQSTQTPLTNILSIDSKEQNGENTEVPSVDAAKKYSKISDQMRKELIDAVENNGEKIIKAANRLHINYSSAKSILKVFKKEGREKKKTIKQRIHKEEPTESAKFEIDVPKYANEANDHVKKQIVGPSQNNPTQESQNHSIENKKDTLLELQERLLQSRLQKRANPYAEDLMPKQKGVFNNSQERISTSNQNNLLEDDNLNFEKNNLNQQGSINLPQQTQIFFVPQNMQMMQDPHNHNQAQFLPNYIVSEQKFQQSGNEGKNMFLGQPQNYNIQNLVSFANSQQIYQLGSQEPLQQSQQIEKIMQPSYITLPQAQNISFQPTNIQQNSNFSIPQTQIMQINNPSMQQSPQYYYMVPSFNFAKQNNPSEMGQQFNYLQPVQQVQFLQPVQQMQYLQPLMYMVPSQVNNQPQFNSQQQHFHSQENSSQKSDEK